MLPPPTAWKAVALLNELHPRASDKPVEYSITACKSQEYVIDLYSKSQSASRGTLMAGDRWLYKLLGIEEDGEDDNLREAGIPPALLFMRGLMRQGGGGGGGDIKTKLAQLLGGAGNVATQIGRGAQDLSRIAQERAGAADTAFQQGLDPIGNIVANLPQIAGDLFRPVLQQPFVPQAGMAFNQANQELAAQAGGRAIQTNTAPIGLPSFRVTPPPGLSAPLQRTSTRRPITNRSKPAFRAPPEPVPTRGKGGSSRTSPRVGGPYRRY